MARNAAGLTDAANALGALILFLPQEYVERFPLAELEAFPGNPKDHDLGVIHDSIESNGWYGVIVAQRSTKRVLAGNGRLETLLAKQQTHAPVLLLDCDDKTARRILLVDNRASEAGGFDPMRLTEFLTDDARAGNLRGSGYDEDDVNRMTFVPAFGPGTADDQGKLDERDPITCPKCGHTFQKP